MHSAYHGPEQIFSTWDFSLSNKFLENGVFEINFIMNFKILSMNFKTCVELINKNKSNLSKFITRNEGFN